LNEQDFSKIEQINSKYIFGHLELPGFMMNSRVPMPDVGDMKVEQFKQVGEVYSGHFHMRQQQNNITYIGNAFPHNFGDAGDDNRGMMILPYGSQPQYISWPEAPKYRIIKISQLVIDPSLYLPINGYIKLLLDSDVSYEEAAYLKETLVEEYSLREMSLVPIKKDTYSDDLSGVSASFQSVDAIVQSQITDIKSEFYDPNLLLGIYRGL
jgi:hypothetical protein